MTLQMSASIAQLAAALARAQAAFPAVRKDKTASIQTRSGGQFSYAYIDLAAVVEATRGPLTSNELALVQAVTMQEPHVTIETSLLHSSGEWLASALDLTVPDTGDARTVGSLITYGRRFGLMALVGLAAADDDTDGAAGQEVHRKDDALARPLATRPRREHRPITKAQQRKLFALARQNHWPTDALKARLYEAFSITTSNDLRAGDFNQALEIVGRGPTPAPTREPSEDEMPF